MARFGRILVAIDGSEASNNALKRAIYGAKALGLELHLVSVAERPFVMDASIESGEDIDIYSSGLQQIQRRSKEQAEEAGAKVGESIILQGSPAEAIVDRAEEVGYDYIVLGRRGSGLSVRFRLGSTTHKVVAYAPCPVVVVPQREDPTSDLGRILVATDGSEPSEKAVARAIQLARSFGKALHMVAIAQRMPAYVSTMDAVDVALDHQKRNLSRILEKDTARAEAEGVEVESTWILEGTPSDVIVRHAERMGYDFIVLGRRGGGLSQRFRIGSTTHKVISYAPCMVVVVPRKDPWRLEHDRAHQ